MDTAQGTALNEFGKANEAAQEAGESAAEEHIMRYVGGGRETQDRLEAEAARSGWGAHVRARKTTPCLGSPRQGAVAERRRARNNDWH